MEALPKENFLFDRVLPIVARIDWLVAGLGLVVRLGFLRPGGDTLMMTGLGGLAVVYALRAFEPLAAAGENIISYPSDDSATRENPVSKLARYLQSFGSMLIFSGAMFKFLFWHGAAFMLSAGVLMLLLASAWQSSTGMLRRQTVLILGLGAFAWAVPTEALLRQLYPDDPALVAKMLYQDQHPHDPAATQAMRQARATWYARRRGHPGSTH